MKSRSLIFALLLVIIVQQSNSQEQPEVDRDTVYYLSPVIIHPMQAKERETPASFSNLDAEQITERYSTQDIPVLLSELPSVTYYSESGNGIGYNYINLRGFDQRRISVMINGVPQNDPEDHNVYWIDFPDILASTGMIQVQRGAGSAFYGPPAIGGSINLVTNPFSRKPGITVETMIGFQEYGNSPPSLVHNTSKLNIALNTGLFNNQYMFYGKFGKIMSDGYRDNSWVEMSSYFLGALRLDNNMTTRLHIFGGPIADGLAYNGLPKFVSGDKTLRRQNLSYWETDSANSSYAYVQKRRKQEQESFSQPHIEVMNELRLSPVLTLNNTLFYYQGDGYYDYDASWADTSMLRLGYNYGIPAVVNPTNALVRAHVSNRQWGWLPRAEITHGNGSLTVGAEIRMHRSSHYGKIQFAEQLPVNIDPDYRFYEYNGEKDMISLFMHEIYRPSDKITVTGDLQLAYNRYGIRNEKYIGYAFSVPYLFLNPRIGININLDEETNIYFHSGYTSREPRLRQLYAAEDSYFGAAPQFQADTPGGQVRYDFKRPLAKPERLLDIESGICYHTTDFKLSANIFWMEFSEELVKSGQVDIFGQPVTGNAERSRHIGIELDGVCDLTGSVSASGNISYSRNRHIRYKIIENGMTRSLDGNPIAGFPDILGNLRLTYHDRTIDASIASKYVGDFYTDNFKNSMNKNDAFNVFNLEISYSLTFMTQNEIRLRAEVRNIFNKLYFMSGEGNSFFPAAERNYLLGITISV